MKTLILGISMFVTGFIGLAILCAAAISTTYTNGSLYYMEVWRVFGVMPIVIGFLIFGIIGIIIAVIGLLKKS